MDTPFGMSPTPEDRGDGLPPELAELLRSLTSGEGLDPRLAEMVQGLGLDTIDPSMLQVAMQQVQSLFTQPADGRSVDPALATDVARKVVAADGDPVTTSLEGTQAVDAVSVATLWLDPVTTLGSTAPLVGHAWSRSQWVEATVPVWCEVTEPVAVGVGRAVGDAMGGQLEKMGEIRPEDLPEGLLPPGVDRAALMGELEPLMRRMHGPLFTLQIGQGVGALADDVLTGCEVSVPLVEPPAVVLLPRAISAFAADLSIDEAQVRIYLAVREVARQRLFSGVPWVAAAVLASVRDYASDISIDTDAIEEAVRSLDPTKPDELQAALQGKLFAPQPSPGQRAALDRLETSLALIEGWVDVVTERAATGHLPQVEALAEAVRRRRASGGPAHKAFEALVGLDLRPRRLRDAANLFAALENAGGAALRDHAWSHPDLAPTSADLSDPLGYVERVQGQGRDAVDDALEELLRGEGV